MDLRSYARLHRSFPHSEQDIRRRAAIGVFDSLLQGVQHYLNGRPTRTALDQFRPNAQIQTETEEAQKEVGLSGDGRFLVSWF